MKKAMITIIGIVCGAGIIFGGKTIVQNKTGNQIITNFLKSNYEYKKSESVSHDAEDIIYKGKIANKPYRGLEECISEGNVIKLVYTYEENGKVYSDMKLEVGDEENTWVRKNRSNRLDYQYNREGMKVIYEGKKKEDGEEVKIFKMSYEYPAYYEEDDSVSIPSIINVRYYLNTSNKTVKKIVIDESEYVQNFQIVQKMATENLTEEEARKALKEEGEEYEGIITFNILKVGEVTIEAPKEE